MRSYRYEERRKKRMKTILINVPIVLVMILIAFFALQIFNQDDNELVNDEGQIENEENEQDNSESADPVTREVPSVPDPIVSDTPSVEEEIIEEEIEEVIEEEVDEQPSRPSEDEWQPIGTTQSELRLEFSEGTVNRQEMDRALSYASGLSEGEMTVWRIENAGDGRSVRGVVSNYENSETPYEIYLEWVDGEGWLPVQLNQLDHNPYLRN